MNDSTHLPTAEFKSYLEYEVVRAARAGNRRRRVTRFARLAAAVLVCAAVGTTAGLASAQIRDSARRDSLLESARSEGVLAQTRLELARLQLAELTRRVQTGAAGPEVQRDAELAVISMESLVMRAKYNVDEIIASAASPRDDLNAPLVAGRDFVGERLRLELRTAEQRLSVAEATAAEAERRFRVGAVSDVTRADAAVDVTKAQGALAVLAQRAALRKEFLEKGTPVDQLMRRLENVQTQRDALVAQQSFELAQQRLALLEKQHAVGVAGELDVLRAQVDLKEREFELQQLSQRLRVLRSARP